MAESKEIFKSALKTVDVTFQNLDSSEISLTDVSHYFDSDPTNLVEGLREDGKKPASFIADTTTANAGQVALRDGPARRPDEAAQPQVVRGHASRVRVRSTPRFKRLNNTLGLVRHLGQVDNWVYEGRSSVAMKDPEMQKRLIETNPNSFRKMVANFLEANGRGYWETSRRTSSVFASSTWRLRTRSRVSRTKLRFSGWPGVEGLA